MTTKTKRERKRSRQQRLREVRKIINDLYVAAHALQDELSEWGSEHMPYLTVKEARILRGELIEVKDAIRGAEDEL
jgi:hypothetical protein